MSPRAKSRVVGYYYMSDNKNSMADKLEPTENAPIHIECVLLKHIVSSAAEAETGALFHNTKMAIFIVKMLEALGHTRETVKIKSNNTTTEVFSNSTLKGKLTTTWDMRWWWLQDNTKSNQLIIYWDKCTNNKANYPTKHFPPS